MTGRHANPGSDQAHADTASRLRQPSAVRTRSPAQSRSNPTYYAGDLRRDLLDAALAVVGRDGPSAVNLRGLARRLGVSHAAPANHFADKTAVFTTIAQEGFSLLGKAMDEAVDTAGPQADAVARLRAIGLGYLRFATSHPAHFDVMWRNDLLVADDPELSAAAGATYTQLLDAVAAAQTEGWAADADQATAAYLAWSAIHGLAVLWLGGPLRHEEERPFSAVAEAVTDLLTRALTASNPRTTAGPGQQLRPHPDQGWASAPSSHPSPPPKGSSR